MVQEQVKYLFFMCVEPTTPGQPFPLSVALTVTTTKIETVMVDNTNWPSYDTMTYHIREKLETFLDPGTNDRVLVGTAETIVECRSINPPFLPQRELNLTHLQTAIGMWQRFTQLGVDLRDLEPRIQVERLIDVARGLKEHISRGSQSRWVGFS
jgi:hypothetical protein